MLPEQIKNYRDIVTLKDGVNVLLRPMTPEDEKCLVELFAPISEEDLRYLRHNVKDPALIHSWCESLDYARVLPLLALVKERVNEGGLAITGRSRDQRQRSLLVALQAFDQAGTLFEVRGDWRAIELGRKQW